MPRTSVVDAQSIERKFSETAFRLAQERSDFLLPQLLDFVRVKKWVNLRPEYQRRLVWDDAKRSLFIESLLLNVPIPPIFLYEYDLSRYEVMDGQQRLNSIVDFYQDGFALRGLVKWHELNGLRYGELPENMQRGLDRRRLSATVLLVERSEATPPQQDEIRKLVFERLNTGGQRLTAQELRNCIYSGGFNDLLIELAREPLFTRIWRIPPHRRNVGTHGRISAALRANSLYSRMRDCEIVLRFFAFRRKASITGSVQSMLDGCMKEYRNSTSDDLKELKRVFTSRLKLAHDLFGDHVFRFKTAKNRWRPSFPLYDGVMVAVDALWPRRDRLLARKSEIVGRVGRLLTNRAAYEVIVGKPNTANAVKRRMRLLERAIGG